MVEVRLGVVKLAEELKGLGSVVRVEEPKQMVKVK